NTTLSNNRAMLHGGGLYDFEATAQLNNMTIAGNFADYNNDGFGDGGGLYNSVGTISMGNSLLPGNVDLGGQSPDCSGLLSSLGHNLIGSTASCTIGGVMAGNLLGANPNL